jgi:uncharacterized protein (DUF1778 family)
MPKQANAAPETRLSIRANHVQKGLLARAATARHMNVSQFVLGASLREAEQVVNDESQIVLSAEEYDWLVKFMDEPDAPTTRLRELLLQKPVWDA